MSLVRDIVHDRQLFHVALPVLQVGGAVAHREFRAVLESSSWLESKETGRNSDWQCSEEGGMIVKSGN